MKFLCRLAIAALAFASTGLAAQAQQRHYPCPNCANGRCPPAPAFVVQALPQAYTPAPAATPAAAIEWRTRRDDAATTRYLFVNGLQAGAWNRISGMWMTFHPATETWGKPERLFPELIPIADGQVPFIPE